MTKKDNPFKKNKNEILWNLINAGIAGALVFLGSVSNGEITAQGIMFAIVAALIVICTKFKEYWIGEKKEYSAKLFKFI